MKQKTSKKGHGKKSLYHTIGTNEKKTVLQAKRVVDIEEKFNMPISLTNVIDNKQE
jgi:acetyl-CoA carboxylase alpha subunit